MKLSLLLLCLVYFSVITAQGPGEGCIRCLRNNTQMCPLCLHYCTSGPSTACQRCVKKGCRSCVRACPKYEGASLFYAKVSIVNQCDVTISGTVKYAGCSGDNYSITPGAIFTHSRGACLITKIFGNMQNGTQCTTYTSSGTGYATFAVKCDPKCVVYRPH